MIIKATGAPNMKSTGTKGARNAALPPTTDFKEFQAAESAALPTKAIDLPVISVLGSLLPGKLASRGLAEAAGDAIGVRRAHAHLVPRADLGVLAAVDAVRLLETRVVPRSQLFSELSASHEGSGRG